MSERAKQERWRRQALASCDLVIADWRERPTGEHSPETCDFCRVFAGCRACPVVGWLGHTCEADEMHVRFNQARERDDVNAMRKLSGALIERMVEMREAIRVARFNRKALRAALRERRAVIHG